MSLRGPSFLVLLLGFAAGCTSSRISDCRFYYNHGEFEKAERCCDDLLAAAPDNADGLFLKGRLESQRGDFEPMNRHFNASLDRSAKYRNQIIYLRNLLWTRQFDLGVDAFNQDDFTTAASQFHGAVKIRPEISSSRMHWSLSRLLAGDDTDDARAYLSALATDTLSTTLVNNMALAWSMSRDWEKVIELTSIVLARDPSDRTALTRRAPALVQVGRFEDAYADYASLLDQRPSDPVLLQGYARISYEFGDYPKALRLYRLAIRVAGEQEEPPSDVWFYMGLCAYELADFRTMAECFETLARRNPADPLVWRNLVVAYVRLKDRGRELDALARLRQLEGQGAGGG